MNTYFDDTKPQTSNLPNSNQILDNSENVNDNLLALQVPIENKYHVDNGSDDR